AARTRVPRGRGRRLLQRHHHARRRRRGHPVPPAAERDRRLPAVPRDPNVYRAARGVRAARERRDSGVVRLPRVPALAVAAIVRVAAVGFWPGLWLSLEWVAQGQIVYGAWRVARGDLPYRDFVHMYGPSLFFLNGALLRWFGEDLAVIRIALLVVKALLAG